jgi:cell division protein ZapE
VTSGLVERQPVVSRERLLADLTPPPRFSGVSFTSYVPDPAEPTQRAAREALSAFCAAIQSRAAGAPRPRRWRRRAPAPPERRPGVYLDGGFGVGKTHLLAALWHAGPAPKAYGTFVEVTNLVGALGFEETVTALSQMRLLAIDEFELDDPGDTVLMSTLLGRLVDAGVSVAATSNTLPDRLGEDRFAAVDFLREIQGLAAHFDVLRIEGEDYRHRGLPTAPEPLRRHQVLQVAEESEAVTLDDFQTLLRHLGSLHPSRYGALVDDVSGVALTGLEPISDQATALRLVVLIDRLYDRDIPVYAEGAAVTDVFTAELLRGGYRKKYARALSRLTALANEGSARWAMPAAPSRTSPAPG